MPSSTTKLCFSDGSKLIKNFENTCKVKSMKENIKAKKESKGPILKRKMACATCRRRKLRCDAARPRCSTCARSQASAEAAGHPSAVPAGPCSYDCNSCDESPQSRFFANGSFHSLTFHSNYRPPMSNAMDPGMENLNVLPPSSPYGVWAWGDMPLTPRVPAYNSSCTSTPLSATPTGQNVLTSTPMQRIISPSLTINATPIQEQDLFYSPSPSRLWTPSPQQGMNLEPMYISPMVSPMVASFSEDMYPASCGSSAASTPLLAATRNIRSPFSIVQDLGTPASMAPSTPCSETFDTSFLGPPIVPKMLSPQEQPVKYTTFLQSLEPMPYDLIDFSNNSQLTNNEVYGFVGSNDLGLINDPMDSKLQEPFTSLSMNLSGLPPMCTESVMMASSLSSAMPIDFSPASHLSTAEWTTA